MKIGIFDSGIGGLTVLREIIKKYPNGNYIYYGDTLHLPYGEKTKKELLEYSCYIIDFLLEKQVDKIVIACGTISSTIYKELQDIYDIEMINVIDATVEQLNKKSITNLAVLATSKTIESHIFLKQLINSNIIEIACPKFVPLIENEIGNKPHILEEYLKPLEESKVEHIILGCTHYPLIENDIKNYFFYPVNCYNMGYFVAESIQIIESRYQLTLYFSKIDNHLKENVKKILGMEYELKEPN